MILIYQYSRASIDKYLFEILVNLPESNIKCTSWSTLLYLQCFLLISGSHCQILSTMTTELKAAKFYYGITVYFQWMCF